MDPGLRRDDGVADAEPVELRENVRALRFPGIDVVRDPVSICGEMLSRLDKA